MNEWIKILLPILLSGGAVLTWDSMKRLNVIEDRLQENLKYIVVFEHLKDSKADHEKRIRKLENDIKKGKTE